MPASRTLTLFVTAAIGVATIGIAPAAGAAGSRAPVAIIAHTTLGEEPVADPFESSLEGCRTGTVINGPGGFIGLPGNRGVFNGVKEFTCTGGAGGFDVALRARFGEPGSTGTWSITAAWGSMAGLAGGGSLVGIPVDGGIDDVYTGTVR
jgi:hypothetical protein